MQFSKESIESPRLSSLCTELPLEVPRPTKIQIVRPVASLLHQFVTVNFVFLHNFSTQFIFASDRSPLLLRRNRKLSGLWPTLSRGSPVLTTQFSKPIAIPFALSFILQEHDSCAIFCGANRVILQLLHIRLTRDLTTVPFLLWRSTACSAYCPLLLRTQCSNFHASSAPKSEV